jgi:two-component system, NarL family, sensor kinase
MNGLLLSLLMLVMFPEKDKENNMVPFQESIMELQVKIDSMLDVCDGLRYSNPDSAMAACRRALEIARKEEYDAGVIRAHLLMGILHDISSKYDSALFHYRTSLVHSHKVGDTLRVASNNANIGLTYMSMGNFREAMEYFLNALGYFEQIGFAMGIASTYNNLGIIYYDLNNLDKSLEYYYKSLDIRTDINDRFGIGAALTNIGNTYSKMDSMELAVDYLERSIAVKKEIDDLYGQTISNSILGGIYIKKGDYQLAQKFLDSAVEISKTIDSKGQEINAYLVYDRLLKAKGFYRESIDLNEKALRMAEEIGSLKFKSTAYKNLSLSYESLGEISKAFYYFKKHIEVKEQLMSHDQINQVFQLELEYEREKKASEIALLNRQAEISALQIEKQELLLSRRKTSMLTIVAVFLIIFLLFYHRYTQQKNREKLNLNNALSQMQKHVARGAIEAEIKERQRIGEELHDSFGQILSLIKLNLTKLQKKGKIPLDKKDEMLNQTVALANKAFKDLRTISHNMSPIMLKTKGLVLSVKDLLDTIDETGEYRINFDIVNMEGNLDPFTEFTLFRTIQELLNNIINHARATEISVQMIKDGNDITIMVEDNGKGFDPDSLNSFQGMGLQNTISRIKNLNGEIIIDSAPGRGTIITIIISCENDEKS